MAFDWAERKKVRTKEKGKKKKGEKKKKKEKQGDLDDAREITVVWCWNVKKKLNFVAAILEFWRPFLNQFLPNLVQT